MEYPSPSYTPDQPTDSEELQRGQLCDEYRGAPYPSADTMLDARDADAAARHTATEVGISPAPDDAVAAAAEARFASLEPSRAKARRALQDEMEFARLRQMERPPPSDADQVPRSGGAQPGESQLAEEEELAAACSAASRYREEAWQRLVHMGVATAAAPAADSSAAAPVAHAANPAAANTAAANTAANAAAPAPAALSVASPGRLRVESSREMYCQESGCDYFLIKFEGSAEPRYFCTTHGGNFSARAFTNHKSAVVTTKKRSLAAARNVATTDLGLGASAQAKKKFRAERAMEQHAKQDGAFCHRRLQLEELSRRVGSVTYAAEMLATELTKLEQLVDAETQESPDGGDERESAMEEARRALREAEGASKRYADLRAHLFPDGRSHHGADSESGVLPASSEGQAALRLARCLFQRAAQLGVNGGQCRGAGMVESKSSGQ